MTEIEWLYNEVRKQFGDKPLREDVSDWLVCHQWEVLQHMFPGCENLLHAVSDDTYDMVVGDLVKDDFGDGLAERLIEDEFDLQDGELICD